MENIAQESADGLTLGNVPRKAEGRFLGARFGRLVVVKFAGRDKGGHCFWSCRCDCQGARPNPPLKRVRQDFLLSGKVQSCGCRRVELMWGNKRPAKQSRRNRPPQKIAEPNYPLETPTVTQNEGGSSAERFLKVEGKLLPFIVERDTWGWNIKPAIAGGAYFLNLDDVGCFPFTTKREVVGGQFRCNWKISWWDNRFFRSRVDRERRERRDTYAPPSIPKCPHGVYQTTHDVAKGDGKASYCSLCDIHHETSKGDAAEFKLILKRENLGMACPCIKTDSRRSRPRNSRRLPTQSAQRVRTSY
jgi:hypothetical protein